MRPDHGFLLVTSQNIGDSNLYAQMSKLKNFQGKVRIFKIEDTFASGLF